MTSNIFKKISGAVMVATLLLIASHSAKAAATIVIQNNDPANMGFNDPTPVSPVGTNTGTTLGQQRLNAFQFAANIWGATLNSSVPITIAVTWEHLSCSANTATLGSSGATGLFANFAHAPFSNTWYQSALANSLAGSDLDSSTPEIRARFNVDLGNSGCLDGVHFYLGLDNNHGSDVDLVAVLMHEFAHGFGFATATNSSDGTQVSNRPSSYDRFLLDNTTGKHWVDMTNAERQASAINNGHLVWDGTLVKNDISNVLGTPRVRENSPSPADYGVMATAAFGAHLSTAGISGTIVQALDPSDGAGPSTTDGCSALTNAAAISGHIAFIDRGICTFVSKVKNAQNAGAIGVIIADNGGNPTSIMGGSDSTIAIASVLISQADGNAIKAQLGANPNAKLFVDGTAPQGADNQGRPLMYAPTTVSAGSSVSHWDTTEFPNQLMEPNSSADETHSVAQTADLTLDQLRDVGWSGNPIGDAAFFTRGQYLDFFNREPDPSGFAFWTKQIYSCGLDQACVRLRTINVSAAFFVSTEFQRTGYLVERLYRSAYGEATQSSNIGPVQVPMVRFNEFQADMAQLEQGVIVGQGNWQQTLENNTQALLLDFVQRPQFTAAYPTTMTPTAFVDQLNTRAGGILSATERDTAIALFSGATDTTNVAARWQALRQVAEDPDLSNAEFNKAFVLMQYFGYLRRNPNDAPDTGLDYSGYEFWLKKLNSRSGDYVGAQMVQAFIDSGEYRSRFGQ